MFNNNNKRDQPDYSRTCSIPIIQENLHWIWNNYVPLKWKIHTGV
jgi:hypothetical protein